MNEITFFSACLYSCLNVVSLHGLQISIVDNFDPIYPNGNYLYLLKTLFFHIPYSKHLKPLTLKTNETHNVQNNSVLKDVTDILTHLFID